MKKAHFAAVLVFAFSFVGISFARPPMPMTNSWTKPSGGNWSEAAAWSLGVAPSWTHHVVITNGGLKTIEVNAAAASRAPLTVSHLRIGTNNTLWLNNLGETFRVDSGTNRFLGLDLEGGNLLNSASHLWATDISLYHSEFVQDGGTVDIARSLSIAYSPGYRLTGGALNVWYMDLPSSGIFRQTGGSVNLTTHGISLHWSSKYNLEGGELTVNNFGISVKAYAAFTQSGGVVRTPQVYVVGAEGTAAFLMDRGELYTGGLWISGGMSDGVFEHNAGTITVTNAIEMSGSGRYYPPQPIPAILTVHSNATLRAASLEMNQIAGFCNFETAGNVRFSGDIQVNGNPQYLSDIGIFGGTLSCANLLSDTGAVDIVHTAGAFNVANTLSFTGYYPGVYNGINARPARYDFQGGTISAPNIDLTAELVIASSSQANRISNSGEFNMGGTLRVGDAIEQLGRFTLVDDAAIILDSGNARISFANSGDGSWNNAATLLVVSWGGSLNGGGADRVRFGTSRGGLTAQQLRQIRFVNPVGLPAGQYVAQILDNGEVVPLATAPRMSLTANPGQLVVTWSGPAVLQASQKVEGPYEDIPTPTSSYAADFSAAAQLFLRLRP